MQVQLRRPKRGHPGIQPQHGGAQKDTDLHVRITPSEPDAATTLAGRASELDLAQYARLLTGLLWIAWAGWWFVQSEIRYAPLVALVESVAALTVMGLAVTVTGDEAKRRLDRYLIVGTLLTIALVAVGGGSVEGYGTDELSFDQAAAAQLLHGVNPYTMNFAYALHSFGTASGGTMTLHGTLVSSISYPSLSFLLYVPFVAIAGGHTYAGYITDLVAWLAAGALIWRLMSERTRPWVPILFGVPILLSSVMGGGNDPLYIPFELVAVCCWDRYGDRRERSIARWAGPVALGLACCVKQIPWLLAPFLIVGVACAARRRGDDWRRITARYVLTTAATFLVPNLPFVVWNLHAWLGGVLLPLTGGLIPMGMGPSGLVRAYGLGGGNLAFFGIAAAAALLALLAAFVWQHQSLKRVMPLLPFVALLLSTRSFPAYFAYALPALAVAAASVRPGSQVLRTLVARRVLTGAAVACGGIALTATALALVVPAPLSINVVSTQAGQKAFTASVDVVNTSGHSVQPQFILAVASTFDQPVDMTSGPRVLAPGAAARYRLTAVVSALTPRSGGEFQIEAGTTSPDALSVSPQTIAGGGTAPAQG